MPPPPFAPTPGTPQGIILTAEQCMATQATLQRLETHLNDRDRSRSRSYHSRCCSHSRDSRCHADDDFVMRQTMPKPKMPDVYKGASHKELYKSFALNAKINHPRSIVFSALFLCGDSGDTVEPMWAGY